MGFCEVVTGADGGSGGGGGGGGSLVRGDLEGRCKGDNWELIKVDCSAEEGVAGVNCVSTGVRLIGGLPLVFPVPAGPLRHADETTLAPCLLCGPRPFSGDIADRGSSAQNPPLEGSTADIGYAVRGVWAVSCANGQLDRVPAFAVPTALEGGGATELGGGGNCPGLPSGWADHGPRDSWRKYSSGISSLGRCDGDFDSSSSGRFRPLRGRM